MDRSPASFRVLIVDDSEINRRLVEMMFTRAGCQVDAVTDGRQAVEVYGRASYDLIVMDCRMPVMAGIAATKIIREIERRRGDGSHVPIIGLTAFAPAGFREQCLRAGIDDCVLKPFKAAIFERIMHEWLLAGANRQHGVC